MPRGCTDGLAATGSLGQVICRAPQRPLDSLISTFGTAFAELTTIFRRGTRFASGKSA